ncbi:MAG: UDP-N-acetylmuramoyl-L-alanyl-D-glutamate--2,6-diaminopimelate ligase [Candidatus Marinimicrobia bacterium]|nr:UDP-N-acetylmuramoyl-L-alanyl-D-glutamate--2,6-diaminopimelate ligase [Candidatus Neomarinimicrobiota bacterium]
MQLLDLLSNINFSGKIEECDIQNITHDSRKVKPGTLFVAIKGLNEDGHDYILDAINRGACAVMSNGRSLHNIGIPVIKVKNPRESMSRIAANFYRHPSKDMNITGVTGTNGKTTITHILNQIFRNSEIPCGTLGTLGFSTPSGMMSTGFTTPESVDLHQLFHTLLNGGIKHAIMEISSHALDLHRVDDVDIDIAIFTNLTPEHLDYHKSMSNYFNAKLKMFKSLSPDKTAIINIDDPWGKKILANTSAKVITYGFSETADIHPVSVSHSMEGTHAELVIAKQKIKINTPFIGSFNLSNIMASVGAAMVQGVATDQIEMALNQLSPVPGRLELIDNPSDGKVLVDYAHTPDAYEKVLSLIRELSPSETTIITLFGCGGGRDTSKRPVMGKIASELSDRIIITSDNPRFEDVSAICQSIVAGISKNNYQVIIDRKKALETAMAMMNDNTILAIFGKGREEYEIVQGKRLFHSDVQIVQQYLK